MSLICDIFLPKKVSGVIWENLGCCMGTNFLHFMFLVGNFNDNLDDVFRYAAAERDASGDFKVRQSAARHREINRLLKPREKSGSHSHNLSFEHSFPRI